MREPIPYLQWKERIDAHTPGNCRVGNDSLIVKQPRETDFIDQSFRLDMTLSVFLASGPTGSSTKPRLPASSPSCPGRYSN